MHQLTTSNDKRSSGQELFVTATVWFTVFIVADAFLKIYIVGSRLRNLAVYPYIFVLSFLLLALSGLLLYRYLHRSGTAHRVWDTTLHHSDISKTETLPVTVIVLAGTVLRFWMLDGFYEGVWFDEAYKGLDAILLREYGDRPLFLNWNGPREPLVAYLVAASTYSSGYSIFAIRAVQALAGSLTLVFFFCLVRTLFSRNIAILSLLLLAFSKYHLIFSRLGFRANLFVLFEAASLLFLAKALRSPRQTIWFVLAGVLAGLGFYTYISYRIFPLVLLAFMFAERERITRTVRKKLLLAAALFVLMLGPLATFYAQNPSAFFYRMKQTSILQQQKENPVAGVVQNVVLNLRMFTFQGDVRIRHNVAKEPALSPFVTAFFLIGLVTAWINRKRPYALFLIIYLLITLLPGILSTEAPHFARNLGSLLPAIILTATGIHSGLTLLPARFPARAAMIVIVGGAIFTGINDGIFRYSYDLDRPYRVVSGMNQLEHDSSMLINSLGDRCRSYLSPQLFFHASTEYLTYPHHPQQLFTADTRFNDDKIAIVFLVPVERDLWWLQDEDQKDYFHWWRRARRADRDEIRNLVETTYDLANAPVHSDDDLLASLLNRYPRGKLLRFPPWVVYVFRNTDEESK